MAHASFIVLTLMLITGVITHDVNNWLCDLNVPGSVVKVCNFFIGFS